MYIISIWQFNKHPGVLGKPTHKTSVTINTNAQMNWYRIAVDADIDSNWANILLRIANSRLKVCFSQINAN